MGKNISAIVAHAAVILAIIITLGLVGAFMSGADAGAGSEKFTGELEQGAVLKVLENDTAKRQGYFDELLAAFNEEYAQYGISAVDANLSESTDLEQDGPYGYGPDVLYQENDKLMRYVDGRHILPLPVKDIECFDEVSETAWNAFLADDGSGSPGVFAVPVNVQGPLLYYRKDLLPENWQEEWDDDGDGICDILQYWTDMYRFSLERREESGGKQFGYMRSFLEPYFSLGYLYSYGGYTFGKDNTDPSDIGHSAGEAEKGAYIIKQLAGAMDERCIDDSVTTGAYSAIASGEFFATIATPDVYTMFVDEMKAAGYDDEFIAENLVAADIPMLPASGDLTDESQGFIPCKMMGGVNGYAISSYTNYPNAALAFVNFATSFEMISLRNEMLGISPARQDVAEEVQGSSAIISNNLAEGNIVVMPSIKENAQIWTPLQTLFQDLARDAYRRPGEIKYDTLEKLKQALVDVDKQIYDAIFTLA